MGAASSSPPNFVPLEDGTAFPHKHIMHKTCCERLLCGLCGHVMAEPVTITPCGHMFDEACIREWREVRGEQHATCPRGCTEVISGMVKAPDMVQLIRQVVKTWCVNDGCSAVLTIDRLEEHLRDHCGFSRFKCTRTDCDGRPCGAVVLRAGMEAHMRVCPYVLVPCVHIGCEARLPRSGLEGHLNVCDIKDVQCACEQCFLLKDTDKHKAVCPCEPVACPVCSDSLPRRLMAWHNTDPSTVVRHMHILAQQLSGMQVENARLERDNCDLRARVHTAEQKLDVVMNTVSTSTVLTVGEDDESLKSLYTDITDSCDAQ